MQRIRLLISWIGHADLRSIAPGLSEAQRSVIEKIVGKSTVKEDGPIKTLLTSESFDEIHLLSNFDPGIGRAFVASIGRKAEVHHAKLPQAQVTDYAAIFEAVNHFLESIRDRQLGRNPEICIHLSPGTPAMTAVWVLLGKTRYPATFFQTHKGRAWRTEIPFDIALDFIPELLRSSDVHFQHLASQSPSEVQGFQQIIGDSQAMRIAVGRARRGAIRSISMLILGESGTGKEMFARAIHAASPRKEKPFFAINCAAIPKELLEAELFGYAKGAFTGAIREKAGAFDEAHGGTLFLDEIGECDPAMQVKLLRILEPPLGGGPCDRVFRPVGGTTERTRDVRVIAATNRDLIEEVRAGRFREDLFYRLAAVIITLPPLRERRADLNPIANHLLARINTEFRLHEPGFRDKIFSIGAMDFVKRHDWPGNVRQLYNALLQAVTMSDGDALQRADLAASVAISSRLGHQISDPELGDNFNLDKHLEDIQRSFLRRAMEEAGGIKTRAAALLGMKNYQTLDAQLKRLRVTWSKGVSR